MSVNLRDYTNIHANWYSTNSAQIYVTTRIYQQIDAARITWLYEYTRKLMQHEFTWLYEYTRGVASCLVRQSQQLNYTRESCYITGTRANVSAGRHWSMT